MNKIIQTLLTLFLLLVAYAFLAPTTPLYADDGPINTTDQAGPDDVGGKADLNSLSFTVGDDDTADDNAQLFVQWNWDIAKLEESENAYACASLDQDDDGRIDSLLCVAWDGNQPLSLGTPTLLSCANGNADDCTNLADLTVAAAQPSCDLSNAPDPFASQTRSNPQADTAVDAQVTCSLKVNDANEITLLNVCSYTSLIALNPADCVVNRQGSGDTAFLEIVKETGDDTNTAFDFDLSPAATDGRSTFSVSGGSSSGLIPLNVGELYELTERDEPNWRLVDASCQINGGEVGDFDPDQKTIGNLSVAAGETVTCTFRNTLQGVVTFEKVVNGGSAQPGEWSFDIEGGAQNIPHNGSTTLDAGIYTVSENGNTNYSLTAAQGACTLEAGKIKLVVDSLTETCRIVNTAQTGRLVIAKQTNPDGADQEFSFTLAGVESFALRDGQSKTFELVVGGYSVSEAATSGWDPTSATCDNGSSPDAIDLDAGEIITCTFMNEVQASAINIDKSATPIKINPGGGVTYNYSVTNVGQAPLHQVEVADDKCTPIAYQSGDVNNNQLLEVGEVWRYRCTMTLAGDTTNLATATAFNPADQQVAHSDTAFVDVRPVVNLTKSVTPKNQPEPGGLFTFTLKIENLAQEAVRILDLVDSQPYGAACASLRDTVLAANSSASCSYTVSQSTPGVYENTATVMVRDNLTATDNNYNTASAEASASVTVTDQPSALNVVMLPEPAALVEPGGAVLYTVRVTNNSVADAVTLTKIEEDSDNNGDFESEHPTTICNATVLAPSAVALCTFTHSLTGNSGDIRINRVRITGVDDDGVTLRRIATAQVSIMDASAAIRVDKRANPDTVPESGAQVTYTVVVTNTSTVDRVIIDEVQDDQLGDIGAGCTPALPATLAPQATLTCTFSLPLQGNAGSVHTNIVTASGEDDDGGPVSASDSATVTFSDLPSALALTKTANPATLVAPGGAVLFSLRVDNTSAVDGMTLNSLLDSVYGSLTPSNSSISNNTCSTPQSIAAGQSYTCTFTAQVSGAIGSTHTNRITASATDDDGVQRQAFDDASVQIIGAAIAATKQDALVQDAGDVGVANPGDIVGYTVVIRNTGNAAGTFAFSDVLDANTTLHPDSITTTQGEVSVNQNSLAVNLGEVAANDAVTIRFNAQINNPLPAGVTKIVNGGLVTGNGLPTVTTDDPDTPTPGDATETPIGAGPLLSVAKTDSVAVDTDQNGVASPGDVLEYRIIVANNGNQAATDVTVDDLPGAYTTLNVGSVTTSQGGIRKGNTGGDSAVEVELGTIDGGQSATVSFRVTVQSPMPLNVDAVSNQALVSGGNFIPLQSDDSDTPLRDDPTVTTVVAAPRVDAFKTDRLLVDADNDGAPSPGDTLVYNITIRNDGTQAAVGIVFSDTLDSNTTLQVGTVEPSQGEVVQGNNTGDSGVVVQLGDIAAGASATLSFEAIIANPLRSTATLISNQGQVTGSNFSPTLTDDPETAATGDPTHTPVAATARIEIAKRDFLFTDTDGNDMVSAGDTLMYVVAVKNQGNITLNDLLLEDTPDAHTSLVNGQVEVSQGAIEAGNASGDAKVQVRLSALAPNTTVNIGFQVLIGAGASDRVVNQAVGRFTNPTDSTLATITVLSDDPDTTSAGDPTVTPVGADGQTGGSGQLFLPLIRK